jgi:hypothetical protein
MVWGYDEYSKSSGGGVMVQNKKYTEYRRPPHNEGATKNLVQKLVYYQIYAGRGIIAMKMKSVTREGEAFTRTQEYHDHGS